MNDTHNKLLEKMNTITESLKSLEWDEYWPYDLYAEDFDILLKSNKSFDKRQEDAIIFISELMTAHGKKDLLNYISELARIEHGIRELEPWVRDHVVHATLTFILGIFIYERWLKYLTSSPISSFQWKLAGLFHDIGYPLEISNNLMETYPSKMNELLKKIGEEENLVSASIIIEGFQDLSNGICSFDLIQNQFDKWKLDIDVSHEYDKMIKDGNICHGIISSLSLLKVIDALYQKYNPNREYVDIKMESDNVNWNQKHFDEDVISACSAIYLHNLPTNRFKKKIDPKIAPLPYLLILSDNLQDWDRPSKNNPKGYSDKDYRIYTENNILNFGVNNRKRYENILDSVYQMLEHRNLKVFKFN